MKTTAELIGKRNWELLGFKYQLYKDIRIFKVMRGEHVEVYLICGSNMDPFIFSPKRHESN